MKNLKVCFNTFWFSFECPGGGEIQLLQTKNALEKISVVVDLYDHWRPSFKDIDVVHSFTVQPGMSYFAENIKRLGIPLVISPIFWPNVAATRGEMWEIERGLKFADLILPNSQIEADLLSKTFDIDPNRFHVVYNGVDFEKFKIQGPNLFREKYSIKEPFLLCVGNIEPRKNQLSVLNALQELNSNFQFICIGNIRDQSYFEKCKSISNFKYIGSVNYADPLLCSAFEAAAGMILVSSFETPGLSALEALYFGCPVLITTQGSTKEYFGKHAYYADPDDQRSIENGIKLICEHKGRESFVDSRFSWNEIAKQTKQAYLKVMR